MVPRPIEGRQTPLVGMQVVIPPPSGGGQISLARLIDFVLQRTYQELTILTELLPRKTDMERKIEIVQFANRARQLFVRLLALVKWAASASKVEKCNAIMAFLDKQSMLFVETADALAAMARESLVNARLPSFHIPCAVEVLTLGTYSRLPTCIRDKIVPPDPITPAERRSTLLRLNQIIQYRLVSSDLPGQMRNLRIENGRVTFHVEHEFEVSLTLMGDGLHIPWRLLDIDILVEDKETGDGKALVHSLQVHYIHQLIQSRLIDNPRPLHDLYNCLHSFCLSLQLEVLHSQVLRLRKERLEDFIRVEEYLAGNHLVVSYWREHIARENQGYRLHVQVDPSDPSKPLQVSHVPPLTGKDSILADQAIKSDHLSIEKLLIHTVHVRTKHKLAELRDELKPKLGIQECPISGSPAVLHIPLLQPCMQSEQMLVTVDTHTGFFLAHIPQFEPPMMDDIEEALNKDLAKLENLICELRFWITLRRCEKTIQHLPAMASEQLPLIVPSDHQLVKFGNHKMFIKLCKHQNSYVVVHLSKKSNTEIEQTYFLMTVQPQQLEDEAMDQKDDTVLDTELPRSYLKVVNFLQLDTFAITHGPCTKVEVEEQSLGGKRKLQVKTPPESPIKRLKHTGYFITELAHVVAMCDERIPFSTLTVELNKRGICHQGMQVEANGTNFIVKIVQMPSCDGCSEETTSALQQALLSSTIRLQGKGTRAWLVEFVFCNCPLISQSAKEQGPRRPVYFMYDFAAGTAPQVEQMVKEMIQDWITMGHLYAVVLEFAEVLRHDQHNIYNVMMDIKSFTYKKLVLGYGQNKASTVTIYWRQSERRFHLSFGVVGPTASASNPHTIVAAQLQHEFNQHHSIATLVQVLHDTYYPLLSISKLSSAPQLGVINSRPGVPVNTFVVIPQTSTHIRIVYRNMYCLDVQCRCEGLVAIRDGAYSVFDKGKAVEDFSSIQFLKAFLNKFIDDSASHLRRRSQSDDDNPLSPVLPLDSLDAFLPASGQLKPGSPAQRSGPEGGTTPVGAGGSSGGLRFHLPLTPPSGSNPHTPASPHTSVLSQGYGASPNPSFSLASPPSLGSQSQQSHVSPSPSMLHMQAPSPGNLFSANSPINPLHVPSPSFLPAPSPSSSSASQVPMQSPAASFMGSQGHDGGSPFPAPSGSTGNLSMSSPATGTWPGSPSIPRPSPRPLGTAQSPGSSSHPALHSPQAVGSVDHKPPGLSPASSVSRVLPQRSWAASIPTILTHKAFDMLCTPIQLPATLSCGGVEPRTPPLPPLERFLGCLFIRRNLHRVIQSDESLTFVAATEPGVIQFKVESMQCRVNFNANTLQSLHLKLSPINEYKEQWTPDELQFLEKFFDIKVVSTPFKPNGFLAFGRLLNAPVQILKSCAHIMRLELFPDRSMKWSVQWCLTMPPTCAKIAPAGMSAVMYKGRMLFFLQLTRIGLNLSPGAEPQTVVIPIVYDSTTNATQLADCRENNVLPPTAPISVIRNMLKRFSDYNPQPAECSIYPAIRELLTNLVIPL